MDKIHEEALSKLKKGILSGTQRAGSSHMVQCGLVFENGEFTEISYDYCFGGLIKGNDYFDDYDDPRYVMSRVMDNGVDEEVTRRFFEYLLNYSPYADIYVSKDAKRVIEDGYYVASTEHPQNLFFGGLIMSRLTWENWCSSYLFDQSYLWDALVNGGVDPDFAYLAALGIKSIRTNNGPQLQIAVSQPDNTPVWVAHVNGFYEDSIRNFINHKPITVSKHTYREAQIKPVIGSTWSKGTPGVKTTIRDRLRTTLLGVAGEFYKKNPFKSGGASYAPFDEGVEALIPVCKEIVKEVTK